MSLLLNFYTKFIEITNVFKLLIFYIKYIKQKLINLIDKLESNYDISGFADVLTYGVLMIIVAAEFNELSGTLSVVIAWLMLYIIRGLVYSIFAKCNTTRSFITHIFLIRMIFLSITK